MYRILDDERRREIHTALWVYQLILCTILAASLSVFEPGWNMYQKFNLSFNIDCAKDAIHLLSNKKSRKLWRRALHRQIVFIKNVCDQRYRCLAVAGDDGEFECLRFNGGNQRLEKEGTSFMVAFGNQLMYIAWLRCQGQYVIPSARWLLWSISVAG